MRKLRIFGIVALALLLIVTAIGFVLPSHPRVSRAVTIHAPPAAIYPRIASFKNGWSQWSGFEKEDPDIHNSFTGPDEGVGATQSWTSKKMGDGAMKIVRADPARGVDYELTMGPGFQLNGSIAMEPAAGGTRVTWTDEFEMGANPYKRLMGQFISVMIGRTFESSLATLAKSVEGH